MNQDANSQPTISPDGYWRWDGTQWIPNQPQVPQPDPTGGFVPPAGYVPPSPAPGAPRKRIWPWIVGGGAALLFVGAVAATPDTASDSPAGTANAASSSGGESNSDRADSSDATTGVPEEQQDFEDVIAEGSEAYEDAPDNELAQKKVYLDRDAALCEVVDRGRFTGWIGTVEDVYESDGLAGLSVAIGEDSAIATWNNSFSDIGDDTMVGKGDVYDALLTLKPGDEVAISGQFLDGRESCMATSNLTTSGKMDSPDFIARFTEVRPS